MSAQPFSGEGGWGGPLLVGSQSLAAPFEVRGNRRILASSGMGHHVSGLGLEWNSQHPALAEACASQWKWNELLILTCIRLPKSSSLVFPGVPVKFNTSQRVCLAQGQNPVLFSHTELSCSSCSFPPLVLWTNVLPSFPWGWLKDLLHW